jgi:2-amino-4-hydroxy-6-hydroxymethyldihydropteridine diphosphokinase
LNGAGQPEIQHYYLGLGSNISPELNLSRALALFGQAVEIRKLSSVWETPPAGSDGPPFLNMAVLVTTPLSPKMMKEGLLREIETQLGRVRSGDKNAPRTIDLDILIAGDQVWEPELWERFYEAVPLAETIPDYTNSTSDESLAQAAARLSDGITLTRKETGFSID